MGYLHRNVELGQPGFGEPIPCPCRGLDLQKSLRERSGLMEAEQRVRLSDLSLRGRPGASKMLKLCQAFAKEPKGILTIWGASGNGKSMALHALVNGALDAGLDALYITSHDLIDDLRRGVSGQREARGAEAHARLKRYATLRVLALDELDKVYSTEWAQAELADLIDRRHRLGLDGKAGTIIAMNTDPDDLPSHIASRLLDGRNRCIYNKDSDLRPALKP